MGMSKMLESTLLFLVKLFDYLLDKKKADDDVQKQWNTFIQQMQNKGMLSNRLKTSYQRQLDELEDNKITDAD